jgi:hypothetical protein
MIPKDQKNITTPKWSTGQLFTAATQHLTRQIKGIVVMVSTNSIKYFREKIIFIFYLKFHGMKDH